MRGYFPHGVTAAMPCRAGVSVLCRFPLFVCVSLSFVKVPLSDISFRILS